MARPGEIVSLLGPSGAGKTSFLRAIMGFEQIDSGRILFENHLLSSEKGVHIPSEERGFSILFQEFVLLPHLNVAENIGLGLYKLSSEVRERRIDELLTLLHIEPLKEARIHVLSGGEQQRVALARALATKPRLILLDEPFSNLDKNFKHQLFNDCKRILKENGTTAILVTHDHTEAFFFSDVIYVIRDGGILQYGSARDIYENPLSPWIASFVGETTTLTADDFVFLSRTERAQNPVDSSTKILVRPEWFQIEHSSEPHYNGVVEDVHFMGPYCEISILLRSGSKLPLKKWGFSTLKKGEQVTVHVNKSLFFAKEN